jgi:hypothetical protein
MPRICRMISKYKVVKQLLEGPTHSLARSSVIKLVLCYSDQQFNKLESLKEVFWVVLKLVYIYVCQHEKSIQLVYCESFVIENLTLRTKLGELFEVNARKLTLACLNDKD